MNQNHSLRHPNQRCVCSVLLFRLLLIVCIVVVVAETLWIATTVDNFTGFRKKKIELTQNTQQYAWEALLKEEDKDMMVEVVRKQCGVYFNSKEQLYRSVRAFIGSYPGESGTKVDKDSVGPWAPSSINFDPAKPIYRVLFLTDIITYSQFSVRTFYHYFFSASADHRIVARLWGIGFPGYDSSLSVASNLKKIYNGTLYFDAVIVPAIYTGAGYVRAEDLRELKKLGVVTGIREHESWGGRLNSLVKACNFDFLHLSYSLDLPSYLDTGERRVIVHVPHFPDFGIFSGFGVVARKFLSKCRASQGSIFRRIECRYLRGKISDFPLKKRLVDRPYDVMLAGADQDVLYPFRATAKRVARSIPRWKVLDRVNPPYVASGKFDYKKTTHQRI